MTLFCWGVMMNKLPIEWIDRLFTRFAAMYGTKFTKLWDGVPRDDIVNTWAEMLADMDKNDLATGLKNCINQPYPPTLPEFRLLCLPKYEPERVFNFALNLRQQRANNFSKTKQTTNDWVMPNCDLSPVVIYWAIMRLDYSYISKQYKEFASVWVSLLDECAKTRKTLPEIPEHVLSLSVNHNDKMDKDVAKKHLDSLRALLK